MTQQYYDDVSEIKNPNHVYVFISDKGQVNTSTTAMIAKRVYGRSLGNGEGLEVTPKGKSYGLVLIEENMFTTIPMEEIKQSFLKLYGQAMADTENVYVLPNFYAICMYQQAKEMNKIIKEIFLSCTDKSKFIFPAKWLKTNY